MPRWFLIALSVLVTAAMGAGCASRQRSRETREAAAVSEPGKLPPLNAKEVYRPEPGAPERAGAANRPNPNARIVWSSPSATLGAAVRAIGEQTGGNIVLMQGLEERALGAFEIKREPLPKAIEQLAAAGDLAVARSPNYAFLFPAGYESLLEVSLNDKLDPRYDTVTTEVVFGSGLPLYTVFSWMSYALDLTIVGDNSIADARCGELALNPVPLADALEAILKSARIANPRVDSTEEYIFFHIAGNTNPASALVNPGAVDPAWSERLGRRVNVFLPTPPRPDRPPEMPFRPSRLQDVVPSLTAQLGVPIAIEKGLEVLPVNPAVFRNVRVSTALDLLVRQWLRPEFCYQVTHDRVVIRRR